MTRSHLPAAARLAGIVMLLASAGCASLAPVPETGTSPVQAREAGSRPSEGRSETLSPAWFARFEPVNAREMVEQVPGFEIRNGSRGRGFGGRPGNVLVNGRRPASKSQSLQGLLERIPAQSVRRIEILRGGATTSTSAARSMQVNVVLADALPPSWTWSARVEQDTDSGGPTPGGRLAVVGRRGDTEWGLGFEAARDFVGNEAVETVTRPVAGPVEIRDERERWESTRTGLNFDYATRIAPVRLQLNGSLKRFDSSFSEHSRRGAPGAEASGLVVMQSAEAGLDHELGARLSWPTRRTLRVELVGLDRREARDALTDLSRLSLPDREGAVELASDTEIVRSERIGRVEVDWRRGANHLLELDAESARNRLEQDLVLRERGPLGRLEPVAVEGGDTSIEEQRAELALRSTWTFGMTSLETSLAAETSELRQAGGRSRSFSFLKPELAVQRTAEDATSRLRLARHVGQLDFRDFASSADFDDGNVDLGNPGLEPPTTWIAELSHRERLGPRATARLRAFHHWIQDLEDRLPIGPASEVPGNIGDGRRWGIVLETTLPLESVGIADSRVELDARWERSRVTDPVTGLPRTFSGARNYALASRFRQDLREAGWAWGFHTDYRDAARSFGAGELTVHAEGLDIQAFLETTRFLGVKMQLIVQNLADRPFDRERQVFEQGREAGDAGTVERRELRRGRSVLLSVSGAF
ncbi:MAG: TonB-dependent receptor plug domain-containing protein [Wenzhouxiangellaceae bacterium]|nr:TonB-dependent receptor plug domain-containing protein [Wenzhouxiangellaceae bacterium]